MPYVIDKFVPFRFNKLDLDKIGIDKVLGKQLHYSCCGKSALYHCMLSLGLKLGDKILVPNYICASVLVPIYKAGLTPVFYDIRDTDLNASLDSIDKFYKSDPSIKAVLVASMYGNPADLENIEHYCSDNHLLLIDDAAQSLGAKIEDRYVGSFGDAGFFSFSPGKATPGHLGAFFWTSNTDYKFKRSHHGLYHFATYMNYYFTRYMRYEYGHNRITKLFAYFEALTKKMSNWWNDDIAPWESGILGGILWENFHQKFRCKYASKFSEVFDGNSRFTVITRGEKGTNNHKLVILCNTIEIASLLMKHLEHNGIFTLNGYPLLDNNINTPVAKSIEKRVIEIPLEDDAEKFDYILNTVNTFL